MRKQILLGIFSVIALVGFNVQAQEAQSVSASGTMVNINLNEILAFEEGGSAPGGMVDLNFITVSDYENGVEAFKEKSLVISSTKAFDVKVRAEGENFIGENAEIPVDVLTIEAVSGGSMDGTLKTVTLNTDDQKIIEGVNPVIKGSLDINYKISGERASTSDILGKPSGTYTQTIIYTATAL